MHVDDRADAVLRAIEAYDLERKARGEVWLWSVPRETGMFLHLLVRMGRYRNLLEIGTSGGYSSIWLALAARATGGRLITIDMDPQKISLSANHFTQAGVSEYVEQRLGAASDILPTLPGPFDFVFIDADKPSYRAYFDLVVDKVVPGGLISADNVVSHGDQMQGYQQYVESHPAVDSVLVPIGQGVEISLKRA